MARRVSAAFAMALMSSTLLASGVAVAQQQQEWFVPSQGQQQPPAQQRPVQRPAQAPAQRAVQPNPSPLPPGEPPPNAVIGIVDVPEVQRNSTAFNKVREEIEKRRQKLNDDLQREQTRWREEQQQLVNQRGSLSPEELRTKERDLQERVTDSQRIFRDRSRNIEQAAQQALQEIEQALAVVIRQVSASRKVNMVLPRAVVIYNDPPFDLTGEVSAQLNKVLKAVALAAEENPAPTPAANNRPAQGQSPAQQAPRRN